MMKKLAILLPLLMQMFSVQVYANDEPTAFQLKGEWWQGKAVETRNTTLVANFDSADSNNANFALGNPEAGGFGMDATVKGKHDLATRVGEDGAHLHYRGGSNINPNRGTIRMLVRGKVWEDPQPRWFFEARGRNFIGIRRDKSGLSLVMRTGQFGTDVISTLDLPLDRVTADHWHSIVASWDRSTGQAWIALDGRGMTNKVEFLHMPGAAQVFYVGGGHNAKYGEGLMLQGLELDELAIYNVPVSVLESQQSELSGFDILLLKQAERGARLSYDRICDLQRWGGWMNRYTWPTQLGSFAQGRRNIGTKTDISNDKGSGTPHIAAKLLYASEVLGDARYFDAAQDAAEFLLAAQDQRGFWASQYTMTVRGIEPLQTDAKVKLQDRVQSHPIYFLAYIYRLTEDERYLDALKRAGEFVLKAQNPNGSWSHHYDTSKGQGETRNGHPHGGELNDQAVNDGINVMVLMYHLTKDRRYVEAVKRAGDWLIAAQLSGNLVGWAEQYDKNNQPVWARNFEPSAWSREASTTAGLALIEVYRLSGDDRYLKPVQDYAAFLKARFPKGIMFAFYDLASGRPIAAWDNKIYFLDETEQMDLYRSFPAGNGYAREEPPRKPIDKLLSRAKVSNANLHPPNPARDRTVNMLPELRKNAISALETQHPSGMWIEANVARFQASLGQGFGLTSKQSAAILRYVEVARIILGEIPPVYRGNGSILNMAYPHGGWYDIDWKAGEN